MLRTFLFWTHLTIGIATGAVVLMMSATGVVLTYEHQLLTRAEGGLYVDPPDGTVPLTYSALASQAQTAEVEPGVNFTPSRLVIRPGAGAPVEFSAGSAGRVYLNPFDGSVLSRGFPRLEAFLSSVQGWHRWFNVADDQRRSGRAVTGAANLGFLVILTTGLVLWIPRRRTWVQFKQVLLFRRGLRPKARNFNWHNVVGIWTALPMILIVASATVISYSWAGELVSAVAGDPPASISSASQTPPIDETARPEVEDPDLDAIAGNLHALEDEWTRAVITLPTRPTRDVTVLLYRGYRGQPQLAETIILDAASGSIVTRSAFDDLAPARRARSFLRFAHTGEYWGMAGQTVAGLVTLLSLLLVYTGTAMAIRRLAGALKRRSET